MMNPNQLQPDGPDPGSMAMMDNLRHPVLVCRQLIRYANSKSPSASIESGIESVLSMFQEGILPDTMAKEILAFFQNVEMEVTLQTQTEMDVGVIFTFLRRIFEFEKSKLHSLICFGLLRSD